MQTIDGMRRIPFIACKEESCKDETHAIVFEKTYVSDLIVMAVEKLGYEIYYEENAHNSYLSFWDQEDGIDLTSCINKHFAMATCTEQCLLAVVCSGCGEYLGVVINEGHFYPDRNCYEFVLATDIENMIVESAKAVAEKISKHHMQVDWVKRAKEDYMSIEDQVLGKVK